VLLALFPGLAGLISLYGLVADSGTIGQHLSNLEGILPEGGLQILRDQLQQLASQRPRNLILPPLPALRFPCGAPTGASRLCSRV
jgi:membrane protein